MNPGMNPLIGFVGPVLFLAVFQFLFWQGIGKVWLRLLLMYVLSVGTGILSDLVWKVGNTASAIIAGIVAPLTYCIFFTFLISFHRQDQAMPRQQLKSKRWNPTIVAAIIQAIGTIVAAIISKL